MKSKLYLVAGMHRSGTSYLSRALSFLGLDLPVSISPSAQDNQKGFFESYEISSFHEALFGDMDRSWKSFFAVDEEWFSSVSSDRAVSALCRKIFEDFPGDRPIVLKDPRISLLIPIWKRVISSIGCKGYFVLAYRHPYEVADSLIKRNQMSLDYSCMVWLNYLLQAEYHSRGERRSFIEFPEWVSDASNTLKRVEADLGDEFPFSCLEHVSEIENEFDGALVHHRISGREIEPKNAMQRLALEVYGCLRGLSVYAGDQKTLNRLDQIREEFYEIAELSRRVTFENYFYFRKDDAFFPKKLLDRIGGLGAIFEKASQDLALHSRNNQDREWADGLDSVREESALALQRIQQEVRDLATGLVAIEKEVDEKNRAISYEKNENDNLLNEIFSLKDRLADVEMERDRMLELIKNERVSVVKLLYRHMYAKAAPVARRMLPRSFVELVKNIVPFPDINRGTVGLEKKKITELKGTFSCPAKDSQSDVVMLSIINWDFRYQRPQHIATGLANGGRRVFYIEMDFSRGGVEIEMVREGVYVVRLRGDDVGKIVPYSGRVGTVQAGLWLNSFYEFCDIVDISSYKTVIVQHPFWWQLARHFPPQFRIMFDCMDDISGFSNTKPFLLDLERELIASADKFVVSSEYLRVKYQNYNPKIIRNAADIKHFVDYTADAERQPVIRGREGSVSGNIIRVGYVGAIAEWFDVDMLRETALSDEHLQFHLCGSVTTKEAASLAKLDNVFMYGEIDYSDVPGFLDMMDVLIIPFRILPIIKACDPVKFYEYSAMGKPTVSTRLPELSRASDIVFFADTPSEFCYAIRAANDRGKSQEYVKCLIQYARENSWEHRVEKFNELIEMEPKVSVVILSYGDPELTIRTVHSLYDHGAIYPNMEVIVVDNGSEVEALDKIKVFIASYNNVTLVENGSNLGFAMGNNVGLELSTGTYVMLLNNDTFVAPGAISAMVDHLRKNPNIGVVGPLTNNIGNEAKLFVEYEDIERMKEVVREVTTGYRGVHTPIAVAAYFAVMFRRNDLDIFGFLSEDYGRGMFEDDDHCSVIKSKGYICALAEDAFVHHHLSATFSTIGVEEKKRLFEENKKKFEKKWGEWVPHKYRNSRPLSTVEKS